MRKTLLMAAVAMAAVVSMPQISKADPNAAGGAAAGAAVGAGAGFLVGGPVGAAVGAGVGGTVGAGASSSNRDTVVIERERSPAVRERSCVRDSAGNTVCQDTTIRR